MSNNLKQGNRVAIVTMFFILAMIAFVTNMAAPLGNIWGYKYSWAGMLGNFMIFIAYLFMGIPSGRLLIKFGYKRTLLIALYVGVVGLFVQYLSSLFGDGIVAFSTDSCIISLNLIIYLLGALICGFCVCILNTVVNPMLNLLGDGGNKGNQLIQVGGTISSLASTLTPFLVGMLIGTLTKDTSMTDVSPLLLIGLGIFILAVIIISFINIVEPQGDLRNATFEHSPWAFRHCRLGVIAIFFYVGIEVGIPSEMNFYITKLGFYNSAVVAGTLVAFYWLLMLIGRFLSALISGKVSTRAQLIFTSVLAIIFLIIAIAIPESITMNFQSGDVPIKCIFIALCGVCTSVMWGCIFNLSTEGLGKYTAKASGLFMTMVVGGGVMPIIQDAIGRNFGYISSYWLVIAMLGYILVYALFGSKNVNNDIIV